MKTQWLLDNITVINQKVLEDFGLVRQELKRDRKRVINNIVQYAMMDIGLNQTNMLGRREIDDPDFLFRFGLSRMLQAEREVIEVERIMRAKKYLEFDGELAQQLLDKKYPPQSVDIRSPFPDLSVFFDKPVTINFLNESDTVLAFFLSEIEMTRESIENQIAYPDSEAILAGVDPRLIAPKPQIWDGDVAHVKSAVFIFGDYERRGVHWQNGTDIFLIEETNNPILSVPENASARWRECRRLVESVFLFVNAKNVELEQTVPDAAVNRKREAKGKKILQPFYTCRIKKFAKPVKAEISQPTGRHVSIRFDVRGHPRHLANGEIVWIPAHQRGLMNDRYVPKVYRAERGKESE